MWIKLISMIVVAASIAIPNHNKKIDVEVIPREKIYPNATLTKVKTESKKPDRSLSIAKTTTVDSKSDLPEIPRSNSAVVPKSNSTKVPNSNSITTSKTKTPSVIIGQPRPQLGTIITNWFKFTKPVPKPPVVTPPVVKPPVVVGPAPETPPPVVKPPIVEPETPPVEEPPVIKPPETNDYNYSFNQLEMLNIINGERAKAGVKPLTLDDKASSAANLKSQDMAKNNYFAHQSPTLGNAGNLLKSRGVSYSTWGENIAKGQRTVSVVMNGWMNSPGHRANILSSNFTHVGFGAAKDSQGQVYWTQIFYR